MRFIDKTGCKSGFEKVCKEILVCSKAAFFNNSVSPLSGLKNSEAVFLGNLESKRQLALIFREEQGIRVSAYAEGGVSAHGRVKDKALRGQVFYQKFFHLITLDHKLVIAQHLLAVSDDHDIGL